MKRKLALACIGAAGVLFLASCESEKKSDAPQPAMTESKSSAQAEASAKTSASDDHSAMVSMEAGIAGGTAEETITDEVTVTSVEPSTRVITLTDNTGAKATFVAGPQIRNLDQLRAGDKLKATMTQRLEVFVRHGSEEPAVTHAAALARAPKGAKPGALIAEAYEVTAAVQSIDTEKRTAMLRFLDGTTKTITVRPDVDLSQYHVGDTVVIRVTEALSVLTKQP